MRFSSSSPPPADSPVVLFDGVCALCAFWARFLIRFDTRRRFRLATLQSDEGRALLVACGLPPDGTDTLVLVTGGECHLRSSAVLRILSGLPLPWKLAAVFRLVPRPLRDVAYRLVARNRYRLFGRRASCLVPPPGHEDRFLPPRLPGN